MAIIYTYPSGTPSASDNILGTQVDPITEENKTVQFGIQDVANLATDNFLETTITITNAQLTALQGTDITLIAAQGTNKVTKILEISVFVDFDTAAFTFAQPILIDYKSISADIIGTIPTSIGQSIADTVYFITPNTGKAAINDAVLLTTSGAVGAGGNTSMQIKLRYQVLDITAF
tara:strand:- start:5003 stop:5530 length:528 start_codon:yes stop_codon:yes gene_type:complete